MQNDKAGVSAQDVADRAGVSRSAVSRLYARCQRFCSHACPGDESGAGAGLSR